MMAECHKSALVLIALVHLLLVVFGLPYILWCVSCLHRIVAFWVEPGVLKFTIMICESEHIITPVPHRHSSIKFIKYMHIFPALIIYYRWPESVHDSTIFDNSLVRAKFENHEYRNNVFLIGNGGYPCRNYLMTSLLNTRTQAEENYQVSLVGTLSSFKSSKKV
ncbi:putative nuclease HARBI1 [Aphis craccivora]|uniref:Putative nuclease HARBI1 n=1 Tax=Aphis craccivora TaxID=307492 RepID=A0A6G0ZBP8_APHCR|nr:putative nuclease HARBI1 [Aphis craccivora]